MFVSDPFVFIECYLRLSQLKRAAWEQSRLDEPAQANGIDPLEPGQAAASKQSPPTVEEVQAVLLKTRKLYQVLLHVAFFSE